MLPEDKYLFDACTYGDIDNVRAMLAASNSDDLKVRDGWGETSLHRASRHGHGDCVAALLDAGADVNAHNNNNKTPEEVAKNEAIGALFRNHRINQEKTILQGSPHEVTPPVTQPIKCSSRRL